MKRTKTNHIHKYQRVITPNGRKVFRCILPDCGHYILSIYIVGKLSICYACDKPFVITQKSATRKKPKCNDCIKKGPHYGNARNNIKIERNIDGKYAKLEQELEEILDD